MSKIKDGGLDRYGGEPFKQQQFGTAGVEGVNPNAKIPKESSSNMLQYNATVSCMICMHGQTNS